MNIYHSLYNALQGRVGKLSLLMLFILLVSGVIARGLAAWPLVFIEPDNVRLLGADPLFHVRHAFELIEHFPIIERWDYFATFPEGMKNDATGIFNLLISAATLVIYGSAAEFTEVATVAIWLTFVIGTGCSLLLYILSRQFMNAQYAVLSVAIFTLFPGSFLDRSLLGFADQHVAEVFLGLWLTVSLVHLVRLTENDSKAKRYKTIFIAMLPFVLLAYTWLGALLYLPILAITLLLYIAARVNAGQCVLFLRNNLTAFSLGIVVIFTAVHFLLPWLEMAPRSTRWLIFGTAGLSVCAFSFLSLVNVTSATKRPILVLSTSVVIFALFTIFLLATEQGQAISEVLLTQRDTLVAEQTEITLSKWFSLLGMAGLLAVIGTLFFIILILQKKADISLMVPLLVGACWHIIWFKTGDFGYAVPAFCAFTSALFVRHLLSNKHKIMVAVTMFAISISLIWPLNYARPPWFVSGELRSDQIFHADWYDAAEWLKLNSPAIQWTEDKPDYGIISAWDFGNIVAAYSQRIPAWSRFPSPYIHHWLTAQTEAESLNWLCPKCADGQKIRYAMVDAKSFSNYFVTKALMANKTVSLTYPRKFKIGDTLLPQYQYNETYHNSLIYRLFGDDGNALAHYRLVYETPQQQFVSSRLTLAGENYKFDRVAFPVENPQDKQGFEKMAARRLSKQDNAYFYNGKMYSGVKIFEIVNGAKVNGTAPLGTELKVELPLTVRATGREFVYQQTTTVSDSGYYQLVVPYPTLSHEGDKSDVIATSNYLLSIKRPGQENFTPLQHFDVSHAQIYSTSP